MFDLALTAPLCARMARMALLASALCAGTAHATFALVPTHTLDLQGVVATASTPSFDIGATRYDNWIAELSGLPASIQLAQGDLVWATITLDAPLTVPTSAGLTSFAFGLQGNIGGDTETNGVMAFYLAGNLVTTWSSTGGTTGTSDAVITGFSLVSPDNPAMTFDKVVSNFTINTLAAPAGVFSNQPTSAFLQYQLQSPVPEPASLAMLLLGLAAVGAAARRRQQG